MERIWCHDIGWMGGGGILPAVNTLSYGLDSERMNKSFYCRSYDNSDKRLSRNLVIAVRFRKITNESRTVVIPKKIRHEFGIRCPGSVLAIDVHYARVQSPDVWRQMSNDRMSKVPVSTDRIPVFAWNEKHTCSTCRHAAACSCVIKHKQTWTFYLTVVNLANSMRATNSPVPSHRTSITSCHSIWCTRWKNLRIPNVKTHTGTVGQILTMTFQRQMG